VLVALGYKQKDVEKVMKTIRNENLDTNGFVKKALALMTK
jgi:Holliday junction DNA helicase RuvA